MRSDHTTGKTYGLKGKTPVVRSSGKRFSCNMVSAITNQGKLYFMIYREKFNEGIFIKFLNKLIRQVDKKVFLIVDRHPSHRSKKVKKWLSLHENQVHLEFLPPYCPELNPDELLNQDVKASVSKKRAHDISEMINKGVVSVGWTKMRQTLVTKSCPFYCKFHKILVLIEDRFSLKVGAFTPSSKRFRITFMCRSMYESRLFFAT